jgi:hypothetical protein
LASTILLPLTWRPGPPFPPPELPDEEESADAVDPLEEAATEPDVDDVPAFVEPVPALFPRLFPFGGLWVPQAEARRTRPEIAKKRMMLSRCATAREWLALMRDNRRKRRTSLFRLARAPD